MSISLKRSLQSSRLPGERKKGYGGFSREGVFALGVGRALWARPGHKRVGWLDFATGAFDELFACDPYVEAVATDGKVAIGMMKSQFVVVDPAEGKKPRRFPAKTVSCRRMALTPDHLLTFQPNKKGLLHVWNRKTFKLEKVGGRDSLKLGGLFGRTWGDALSPSGHAAFYVDKKPSVEVWGPPWSRPSTFPMPADKPIALGLSSDGTTLAVLFEAKAMLVDLGSGKSREVKAPSPKGPNGALRAQTYTASWVHPLPGGQLLIVDFAHGASKYDEKTDESWEEREVVVTLFDTSGKRLAAEALTFKSNLDYSFAEAIAVGDDGVLLNRERRVALI